MLSKHSLPASLSGIESLNFSMYWNAIKDKIQDLYNVGYKISLYQQKLGTTIYNLKQKGDLQRVELLQDEVRKVNDDLQKYWKVKGYLDKYLPEWMKASQPGTAVSSSVTSNASEVKSIVEVKPKQEYQLYQPKTFTEEVTGWVKSWFGLGQLPMIVLGAASLAALAYVVNTGMALVQDYMFKVKVLDAVEQKILTPEQGADVIKSGQAPPGVLERVVTGIGTNVGTIALIGVILFVGFYAYGIKKAGSTVVGG
ncbi:MAG: hypothetical protein QXT45_06165 [Candidatus Bilamarchaeaceae archaeon]